MPIDRQRRRQAGKCRSRLEAVGNAQTEICALLRSSERQLANRLELQAADGGGPGIP